MRIEFDEKGNNFIEIREVGENIAVILSSQDGNNISKTIVNSVYLTKEQFSNIIKELGL